MNIREAKYVFTTSHRPSPRLRSFVKDLVEVFPRAVKVNRGKKSINELYVEASEMGASRVIVVEQRRGNPGVIRVYCVDEAKQVAEFRINGVKLLRETPDAVRPYNVRTMAVEVPNDPVLEDYAEAVLKAFMLEVKLPGRLYDVVIKLRATKTGRARLLFWSEASERLVGPTFTILRCKLL